MIYFDNLTFFQFLFLEDTTTREKSYRASGSHFIWRCYLWGLSSGEWDFQRLCRRYRHDKRTVATFWGCVTDDRRADGGRHCAETSVSSTNNCNWNVRPKYSALNCFNFTMPWVVPKLGHAKLQNHQFPLNFKHSTLDINSQ